MDLSTQLVLGASVGYSTLGKEAGRKSLLWGAVGGIIPDLDTLATLALDPVDYLGVHRGFTHSFLFAFIFAPLMGFVADRVHPKLGIFKWTKLFFWSIITHPILDTFTAFGTQLFQPFWSYPVSFRSISIIDPIYTVPFYICVLTLAFRRYSVAMGSFNNAVLVFTTAYLGLTLVSKYMAHNAFSDALERQNVTVPHLSTSPTLFNNLLWMGLAQKGDTIYVGMYSHLDEDNSISFTKVPRQTSLISAFGESPATQKLTFFSRGFYRVEKRGEELYFSDLRFGRSDLYETDAGSYTFDYKLIVEDGKIKTIDRQTPQVRGDYFSNLFTRIGF